MFVQAPGLLLRMRSSLSVDFKCRHSVSVYFQLHASVWHKKATLQVICLVMPSDILFLTNSDNFTPPPARETMKNSTSEAS